MTEQQKCHCGKPKSELSIVCSDCAIRHNWGTECPKCKEMGYCVCFEEKHHGESKMREEECDLGYDCSDCEYESVGLEVNPKCRSCINYDYDNSTDSNFKLKNIPSAGKKVEALDLVLSELEGKLDEAYEISCDGMMCSELQRLEAELDERNTYIECAINTLDGNLEPVDWRKDNGELLRKIAQSIEAMNELEEELKEERQKSYVMSLRNGWKKCEELEAVVRVLAEWYHEESGNATVEDIIADATEQAREG